MSRTRLLVAIACLLLCHSTSNSQSQTLERYEAAVEFSMFNRSDLVSPQTEFGGGARFTFNLNENFALDSSAYFFPRRRTSDGSLAEFVSGLKAGKRFKSWGIFAKARPGVVSFSRGDLKFVGGGGPLPLVIQEQRLSTFATDLGGVLELYPSKRIVTRFDAGDTIVHFRPTATNAISFDSANNGFLIPFTRPARTTHNFQFSASVGVRF
jgi:hypothetical protein